MWLCTIYFRVSFFTVTAYGIIVAVADHFVLNDRQ
jgi:hypothetical protein